MKIKSKGEAIVKLMRMIDGGGRMHGQEETKKGEVIEVIGNL